MQASVCKAWSDRGGCSRTRGTLEPAWRASGICGRHSVTSRLGTVRELGSREPADGIRIDVGRPSGSRLSRTRSYGFATFELEGLSSAELPATDRCQLGRTGPLLSAVRPFGDHSARAQLSHESDALGIFEDRSSTHRTLYVRSSNVEAPQVSSRAQARSLQWDQATRILGPGTLSIRREMRMRELGRGIGAEAAGSTASPH